jgi:hypothetical protein
VKNARDLFPKRRNLVDIRGCQATVVIETNHTDSDFQGESFLDDVVIPLPGDSLHKHATHCRGYVYDTPYKPRSDGLESSQKALISHDGSGHYRRMQKNHTAAVLCDRRLYFSSILFNDAPASLV